MIGTLLLGAAGFMTYTWFTHAYDIHRRGWKHYSDDERFRFGIHTALYFGAIAGYYFVEWRHLAP